MRATASKLKVLQHCSWWARPEVEVPERPSGPYAAKGTALHALVEAAPNAEELVAALPEKDAADVREWHDAWAKSTWARIPWQHEVVFAWAPERDEARELMTDGHRDYSSAMADELVGTADLVLVDDDSVTVADIKTGWQAGREPIAQHTQLRFLAMAAARARGKKRAFILLLDVGAIEVDPEDAELDEFELDAIAGELLEHWQGIATAEPRPGAHCTAMDCAALSVCPATKALAASSPEAARTALEVLPPETDEKAAAKRATAPAVVSQPEWSLATTPESDAHALWLRDAVPVIRKFLDQVESGVEAYADARGGIPCGDGKVWGRVDGEMEKVTLDGPGGLEAKAWLENNGYAEAIETRSSTSKEGITKAVKAQVEARGVPMRGEVKAAADAVFAELRMMGAMRTIPTTKYAERKARVE